MRDDFSEDYIYEDGNENYKKIEDSENYESDNYKFIRQPFSEDYLVEEK